MGALFFAMAGVGRLARLLYVGLALALVATALYLRDGRRELRDGSAPTLKLSLTFARLGYARSSAPRTRTRQRCMDTFPDLGSLSDQELKDLIQQLTEEEHEVSYRRRILHGKIDILRAELVNRLRKKHEGGEDVISATTSSGSPTSSPAARPAAADERPRAAGAGSWRCTAPSAASSTSEGANYCQKCGAFLGAPEPGATTRPRRPTGSTRPASSSPVEVGDVAARGRARS